MGGCGHHLEALDRGPGSLHGFGLTSMTLHVASATVPKAGSLPRAPGVYLKFHSKHDCGLLRSVNGDVRFFDPRMPESVNVMQIVKGLTALDIHPQANLIAW